MLPGFQEIVTESVVTPVTEIDTGGNNPNEKLDCCAVVQLVASVTSKLLMS